jgi:hypothetical protein
MAYEDATMYVSAREGQAGIKRMNVSPSAEF